MFWNEDDKIGVGGLVKPKKGAMLSCDKSCLLGIACSSAGSDVDRV